MLHFGRILVIVAHPDDETLGCGGLIANYSNQDCGVRVVFVAEGTSCRYKALSECAKEEIEYRNQCAINALNVLGIDEYVFYNLPCGRLGDQPLLDIAKIIEKEISDFKPDTVLTHHRKDVNNDHKVLYRSVVQATRPVGHVVKNVLSFEVLSSTEWNYVDTFKPNVFVDISSTIDTKICAMNCYTTEQPEYPHPRSDKIIRNLATIRGSQSGFELAEGFELIRLFTQ